MFPKIRSDQVGVSRSPTYRVIGSEIDWVGATDRHSLSYVYLLRIYLALADQYHRDTGDR